MGMRRALLLASIALSMLVISGLASAQSRLECRTAASCASGETDVMQMSDLFNAHAKLPSDSTPNWYAGSGWNYRRGIALRPATPLSDYQVRVELNQYNFDYSKARSNGGDIRFYSTDGTKLSYWKENWSTAGTSVFWVKVPSSGTSQIYMFYGNPSASSESNGDATFYFYDDFNDGFLNASKWMTHTDPASVQVVEENGENVHRWVTQDDTTWGANTYTKKTLNLDSEGYVVTFDVRHPSAQGSTVPSVNVHIMDYAAVTWGAQYYDEPQNNMAPLVGKHYGISYPWLDYLRAFVRCKISVTLFDSTTYESALLEGTCDEANIAKRSIPYTGSVTQYSISFGTGDIGVHNAYWDNVTIRKYKGGQDPVASVRAETPRVISPYPYKVCCRGPVQIGTLCSGEHVEPLSLSYATNAHAETTPRSETFTPNWYAGSGWSYRKTISMSPATPLNDYQVRVELNQYDFDYYKTRSDGGDIRFYSTDGTKLSYWKESWSTAGTSVFWVKVPSSGTSQIYMFYGNPAATSESNIDATFYFYDDFNDGVLDASKWMTHTHTTSAQVPQVLEENGENVHRGGSSFWGANTYTKKTLNLDSEGYILTFDVRHPTTYSGTPGVSVHIIDYATVAWGATHYDEPNDNMALLIGYDYPGDGNRLGAFEHCKIRVTLLGSRYESALLEGTCDKANIAETSIPYRGLVTQHSISFTTGDIVTAQDTHDTYWDNVTIRKYKEGQDPVTEIGMETPRSIQPYQNKVCLSGTQMACGYSNGNCRNMGPIPGDAACLVSISGAGNAHIANCTGSRVIAGETQTAYDTKVCCWFRDITSPMVDIDYAGPDASRPHTFAAGDSVTFKTTAFDRPGGTGLKNIKIYVNGVVAKSCTTPQELLNCEYSGGPFAAGQAVTMYATAEDMIGNSNTSVTRSFKVCKLLSAFIDDSNCPADGCWKGDQVTVHVTYEGTTCPAAPDHIFGQVDAESTNTVCHLEAKGIPPSVDMIGIGADINRVTFNGSWTVPDVPVACWAMTVAPFAASITNSLNPDTWKQFGFLGAASGAITGEVKFAATKPALVRVYADPNPLYVKQGQAVAIKSEGSSLAGPARLDCGSTSDSDNDGYADESGGQICATHASATINPECSFVSPWPDSRRKVIYCRLWDTIQWSNQVFTPASGTSGIFSDNKAPAYAWNSPPLPSYFKNGATISIDVSVSEPNLDDGSPGAGINNGEQCNPQIDGASASFNVATEARYSDVTGRCTGAVILKSPSGLADGQHQLSVRVQDKIGNVQTSNRQIIIDNTPPEAWLHRLPKWTNSTGPGGCTVSNPKACVNFDVAWEGRDASPITGHEIYYSIYNHDKTQHMGWTLWKPAATASGTRTFGQINYNQADPVEYPLYIGDPSYYDGKTFAFKIKATDEAGNVFENTTGVNTSIDVTPPRCYMEQPGRLIREDYWGPGSLNLTFHGTDKASDAVTDGSGIVQYMVYYSKDSGSWYAVNGTPSEKIVRYANYYCNIRDNCTWAIGMPLLAENEYSFTCKAVDEAGNNGPSSTVVGMKVDASPPYSVNLLKPGEWANSTVKDRIVIKAEFEGYDKGCGVKCFYLQWKNCTHIAKKGAATCSDTDWGDGWHYITDDADAGVSQCLATSYCEPPSAPESGKCYGEMTFNGTYVDDSGPTREIVARKINSGEIIKFRLWAKDVLGNTQNPPSGDPIVDAIMPRFKFTVMGIKGTGEFQITRQYYDESELDYVNLTSFAWDSISGIDDNIVEYIVTDENGIKEYTPGQHVTGEPFCEWDGTGIKPGCVNTTWTEPAIPYGKNTVIKFRIWARDRAGNVNTTSDTEGWFYITTHTLANFAAHHIYMALGQSFDLKVQVRNLQNFAQNITLALDPGTYEMAEFLSMTGAEVLDDGRTLKTMLNAGEDRVYYVRIFSSSARDRPYELNMTATSGAQQDKDTAYITIGYPASFPEMDGWAIAMLMALSVAIYLGMGPKKFLQR